MSDQEQPRLPAETDADDESPTIDITRHVEAGGAAGAGAAAGGAAGAAGAGGAGAAAGGARTERWTGSARVPAPGTGRRRDAHLRRDDDENTLDLPEDDYPGPSLWERWRSRRRRLAAAAPAPAAPPATRQAPAHPAPRQRTRPPAGPPPGYPAYPPGWPPGYGPQHGPHGPHGPHHGYGPGRPYGPPYEPRYGPPPPPLRRRRRWPWWMLFFLLASAVCCGGCVTWARPYVDEYPATILTEADVPGLTRSTDAARGRAADELLALIESEQIDEQSVRLLYNDQRQRSATVVATTRFVLDPKKDLTDRFTKLTAKLKLTGIRAVDSGELGGYQQCAAGSLNGRSAAVCGWADHGSLAVGVFPGRSVDDAAALLDTIRGTVLKRG
jgi:hypothetical protein